MEPIKVCRICLNMDVKMHDLRSYPLDSYYESVLGSTSNNNKHRTIPLHSNLPPYACYECAALVRKFYFFKQKSLRSQAVLNGVTDDCGMVTVEDIKAIDRQGLLLTSGLKCVVASETDITCISDAEIKIEPDTEQGDKNKFKFEDHDYDTFIPVDHDYDTFNPVDHNESSDDDTPLSHHKEKKSKKIQNDVPLQVEELELKKESEDAQASIEREDAALEQTIREVPRVVKRKQIRRPRSHLLQTEKFSNPTLTSRLNNLGDFTTVINLTLQEQIEEIEKRKESSNYLNSPYQCNLCYKGFIDTNAWQHHLSKHSPDAGSIECQVCKFRFKTKRALQKHAANHEKKYACKSCPYISTNTTQAKQHEGWHKGVTFKCKYCDEVFTIWTSYMSHVRIKHPSEFICGVCGYSFISKLGLSMHKTMMHKDVQEKPEEFEGSGTYCEECDVKFISMEAYKRHMVMSVKHTQTTDSIKGCRSCGATFDNNEDLRLHHRKEHSLKRPKNYGKKPSNNTWPVKCEHCPEEIANGRDYWTHFRRAHPDKKYPVKKDYVCDICGKSFRGNAFLVYHRRTHFEERAYKCNQCDKAFFNRTNLLVHEKTHSEDRPYPCSVCFKAFKCKAALDRHFRTHTGQKPYECEVCGKGFSQSNSRKLHVRTVHLKQPAPYISRTRQERRKTVKEQTTQPFLY